MGVEQRQRPALDALEPFLRALEQLVGVIVGSRGDGERAPDLLAPARERHLADDERRRGEAAQW